MPEALQGQNSPFEVIGKDDETDKRKHNVEKHNCYGYQHNVEKKQSQNKKYKSLTNYLQWYSSIY